ncbi:hypothetical protein CHARACLAT_004274 [Characodon lateralis]|uniref:Uncharacterized protein n=1 Tax=Characodon lateralis TaxID=208331 RepID=A0ABU7DHP6_9TELE|nr:hypothetical protein [Characodon lateralis]
MIRASFSSCLHPGFVPISTIDKVKIQKKNTNSGKLMLAAKLHSILFSGAEEAARFSLQVTTVWITPSDLCQSPHGLHPQAVSRQFHNVTALQVPAKSRSLADITDTSVSEQTVAE